MMEKQRICILLLLIVFCSAGFTQDYIIRIGNSKYTAYDIRIAMEEYDCILPDSAVEILAEEEALDELGQEKRNLYTKFFGKEIEKDRRYAGALEMVIRNKQATSRLSLFTSWLESRTRKIPVVYLDIEQYWDIIRDTESYRIREQVGKKLHFSDIPYTIAELQIPGKKALALKDGKTYLSTPEFNNYIEENYADILFSVKRKKSVIQVQKELIKKITAEKLLTETRTVPLDGDTIEKEIEKYVMDHLFTSDLDFTGENYFSPAEMLEAQKNKYRDKEGEKLGKMKKILEGKVSPDREDFTLQNHVRQAQLKGLRSAIKKKISNKKIYTWMEETNFPGSVEEAHFVLANVTYETELDDVIVQHNIVFPSVE
jgi:hypothetical protein